VAFVPGSQGLARECFADLEDSAVRFSNISIQVGRLACILNRNSVDSSSLQLRFDCFVRCRSFIKL
jgi:hypothetical protein